MNFIYQNQKYPSLSKFIGSVRFRNEKIENLFLELAIHLRVFFYCNGLTYEVNNKYNY